MPLPTFQGGENCGLQVALWWHLSSAQPGLTSVLLLPPAAPLGTAFTEASGTSRPVLWDGGPCPPHLGHVVACQASLTEAGLRALPPYLGNVSHILRNMLVGCPFHR